MITKSSILDIWQNSEYISTFGITQSLHYGIYEKEIVYYFFVFCWKLVFVSVYNVKNIFTFPKTDISSLLS